MKILVLNGSPRLRGTTASMLRTIVEAIGDGHEIEWVDAYRLKLSPCRGCLKCRPHGECILPEDDGHRIWRSIREADALLVGTPVYWGNMSAPLKALLDRVVTALVDEDTKYFPRPRHRGKRAVVVTACICPWPFCCLRSQAGGTLDSLRTILGMAGFRLTTYVKADTAHHPHLSEREQARIRNIARKLR